MKQRGPPDGSSQVIPGDHDTMLDRASKDRGPGASIDESGFPVQFAAIRVAYTILE